MSNALTRTMNRSITATSLGALVKSRTNENPLMLLDASGSMGVRVVSTGKTRMQMLREAVTTLQSQRQTTMAAFGLIGASHDPTGIEPSSGPVEVAFVTEVPDENPAAGTPMAEAILFAKKNNFGRALIISDGGPNDPGKTMAAAREFGGRIDVVYVGDPGDAGSRFLEQLAEATGGQRFEGDLKDTKQLASTIRGLLVGEALEEDDEDDEDDDEDEEDEDEEDEDEA